MVDWAQTTNYNELTEGARSIHVGERETGSSKSLKHVGAATLSLDLSRGLIFSWWECCSLFIYLFFVCLFVFYVKQPSLPTPFYSVLVSISVFMALSTVFHSVNFPDNSPLSYSVLLVLFLTYWSFQLYIALWMSSSALLYSFAVVWA